MTNLSLPVRHLLLLAGSGEAREIARLLAMRGDIKVTASLLDTPRSFGPLAVATRFGRFGGEAGLSRFLHRQGITAVMDATHPFAAQISALAARVCGRDGLRHVQLLRPQWRAQDADQWQEAPDETAAARLLRAGQRVFVTSGRATLAALVHDCPAQFLVRQMKPRARDPDLPNVTYIDGRGPFSVADEIRTLRDLNIDVLVVKNSGGLPSRTKLDAARALGIPVILIARPPQPKAERIETVDAAMAWIQTL